jgi:predicted RNA-binding Zn-ribbon protein involved in translation (DUF1610 family)
MPHDLLPLLLPLALILSGSMLVTLASLRTRRPYPSCVRCEYDLSWLVGAVNECPECGTTLRGGRFRPANQRATGWESAHAAGVVTLCLGGLVLSVAVGMQFL